MTKTNLLILGILAAALVLSPIAPGLSAPETAAVIISDVNATPLKTGWRAVITWRTNAVSIGIVEWGFSASAIGGTGGTVVDPKPGFDHAAVLMSPPMKSATVYYKVTAVGADAAVSSSTAVLSFVSVNGPTDWSGSTYDFNMYWRTEVDQTSFTAYTNAASALASRIYDASDGYMRLGTVVIEDSNGFQPLGNPDNIAVAVGNQYECRAGGTVLGAPAGSKADVTFLTGQLFIGDTFKGAIDTGCPISMPVVGGQDGAWLVHEFGHYAWWSNDLYAITGGCQSSTYDVSIMDDPWLFTELDSSGTPCTAHNTVNPSWTDMIAHYPNVPDRTGTAASGPSGNGGIFSTIVINRL